MTSWQFWTTLAIGVLIVFFLLMCIIGVFIIIQARLRDGQWPRCNKLHRGRVGKGGKDDGDDL